MTSDERPADVVAREKFAQFLIKSFVQFQAKAVSQARPPSQYSQRAFAQWLEINETELSRMLNGARMPQGETVYRMAKKLGPEVYDLVGMPRMMPRDRTLYYVSGQWHKLPDHIKAQIREIVRNWEDDDKEKAAARQPKPLADEPKASE